MEHGSSQMKCSFPQERCPRFCRTVTTSAQQTTGCRSSCATARNRLSTISTLVICSEGFMTKCYIYNPPWVTYQQTSKQGSCKFPGLDSKLRILPISSQAQVDDRVLAVNQCITERCHSLERAPHRNHIGRRQREEIPRGLGEKMDKCDAMRSQ